MGLGSLLAMVVAMPATTANAGKGDKLEIFPMPPKSGVTPPKILEGGTFTPSPPEVKGWPHAILTGYGDNCTREPLADEVVVFIESNFAGGCSFLKPGFYPHPGNIGVGDNAITSIKVGAAVRARVFKNPVYAKDWNLLAPGTRSGGLGAFNDVISSMRVELASRSLHCDDLRDGEIALFENERGQGDCVVLPGEGSYASAESMGIEDDSISSMHNYTSQRLIAFWNPSFSKTGITLPKYSLVDSLPTGGTFSDGLDNDISSIQIKP